MKAIKPQMIKFLLLSVIIVLVTTTTTAQEAPEAQRDTTNTVSHLEFAIGYNIHSVRFACPTLQFRYFVDVTPKIAVGGGFGHEGWLLRDVIGGTTPDFPFHQFQVSAYKFGGALSAMYHFNKGHLELDAYLALYCYNYFHKPIVSCHYDTYCFHSHLEVYCIDKTLVLKSKRTTNELNKSKPIAPYMPINFNGMANIAGSTPKFTGKLI